MANYSDIKGFTVQTLSTDTIANQMAGGSWASGGNVNTGRYAMGSVGLQTAALIAAGSTGSNSMQQSNIMDLVGQRLMKLTQLEIVNKLLELILPLY